MGLVRVAIVWPYARFMHAAAIAKDSHILSDLTGCCAKHMTQHIVEEMQHMALSFPLSCHSNGNARATCQAGPDTQEGPERTRRIRHPCALVYTSSLGSLGRGRTTTSPGSILLGCANFFAFESAKSLSVRLCARLCTADCTESEPHLAPSTRAAELLVSCILFACGSSSEG